MSAKTFTKRKEVLETYRDVLRGEVLNNVFLSLVLAKAADGDATSVDARQVLDVDVVRAWLD